MYIFCIFKIEFFAKNFTQNQKKIATLTPVIRRNMAAKIGGWGESGMWAKAVSNGIKRSPPPSIEKPLTLTYRTAAQ